MWPSPSDYQDAVQNPRLCFDAPELKEAEVARGRLGLPRVASGNFASVYELRSPKGRWAVRCFLRPVSDQERRYHAISEYLNANPLRWLVDFDYLPRGIRVRGAWYPIVKMDWVDGVPLHRHVEELLGNSAALLAFAYQWRSLVADVRAKGIAHGDYQHGNVLVAGGEMRLVDYDGMYVPPFRGERSPELGRLNYQHPARCPEDYGPDLDNFSALVIYLSLRALALDPDLWRFHDGDNLVLTGDDFRAPGTSAALAGMRKSDDAEVRALAGRLASLCALPLAQAPPLDAVIAEAEASRHVLRPGNPQAAGDKQRPATAAASRRPAWLEAMSTKEPTPRPPAPTPGVTVPAVAPKPTTSPTPAPAVGARWWTSAGRATGSPPSQGAGPAKAGSPVSPGTGTAAPQAGAPPKTAGGPTSLPAAGAPGHRSPAPQTASTSNPPVLGSSPTKSPAKSGGRRTTRPAFGPGKAAPRAQRPVGLPPRARSVAARTALLYLLVAVWGGYAYRARLPSEDAWTHVRTVAPRAGTAARTASGNEDTDGPQPLPPVLSHKANGREGSWSAATRARPFRPA